MWSFGSLWKKYNKNARNRFVIVTFPIPGFVSVVFKKEVRQKNAIGITTTCIDQRSGNIFSFSK